MSFQKPTDDELANRFMFHPCESEDQGKQYEQIRFKALELALLIRNLVPCSPELMRAINHVDEAMMVAIAGIARHWGK